jgi:hypothetical protein
VQRNLKPTKSLGQAFLSMSLFSILYVVLYDCLGPVSAVVIERSFDGIRIGIVFPEVKRELTRLYEADDVLIQAAKEYFEEYLEDFERELQTEQSVYWATDFMQRIKERIAQRADAASSRQA